MDQNERIRKYWHGQLTSAEKQEMETALENDEQLAQDVQHFRDLQLAISATERQALKQRLGALPVSPSRRRLWPMAIAASILLLIAGSWYYLQSEVIAPETLFATYYQPYPNLAHPIVRNQDPADSLSQAFAAYEQGRYTEAQARLDQLVVNNDNPELRFYLALSLMGQANYNAAQQQLDRLKGNTFQFQAQVWWYQALVQLRKGDLVEARASLLQLQKLDSSYKNREVGILLKQLEKQS